MLLPRKPQRYRAQGASAGDDLTILIGHTRIESAVCRRAQEAARRAAEAEQMGGEPGAGDTTLHRNQFNFSERACQTAMPPMRDREIATQVHLKRAQGAPCGAAAVTRLHHVASRRGLECDAVALDAVARVL